jgi:hypothetical protein
MRVAIADALRRQICKSNFGAKCFFFRIEPISRF